MNKQRRATLRQASGLLDRAIDIIKDAQYDEQECLDNLPENLQEGDKGSAMEDAIDNMDNAIDKINDAKEYIDEAMA